MKSLQTVIFEDTNLEIWDHEGEACVTVVELSKALGYKRPDELRRLIGRKSDEFIGKVGDVKLTSLEGGVKKIREFMVINYHGIIRAGFLAKTDRAKRFRDWAEQVLCILMIKGHIDLRDKHPIDLAQERLHKDLAALDLILQHHPGSEQWVFERMGHFIKTYEATYQEPVVGVTRLTEDWFKHLYGGKKWSRDAIETAFYLDISNDTTFESYRKQWNVPTHKSIILPPEVARRMFRDHHTPHISKSMDELIVGYKFYSRDSIRKNISKILSHIVKVLLTNQNGQVLRFNKVSYAEYLASELWDNKRHVMLAPTGPFDYCWICGEYISLSTGHLHHLTYDHVGYETWDELCPLCAPCHRKVHHLDKIPQDVFTGEATPVIVSVEDEALQYAIVPKAHAIGKTPNGAIRIQLPNGHTTTVNRASILPESDIKDEGHTGTFMCMMTKLFPQVKVALSPWATNEIPSL
jgi:hypothetical protein